MSDEKKEDKKVPLKETVKKDFGDKRTVEKVEPVDSWPAPPPSEKPKK